MSDCPLTISGTCCPDNEVSVVTGPLIHVASFILPQINEIVSIVPSIKEYTYTYSSYDFDYIYEPIHDIGTIPFLYTSKRPLYVDLINGMTVLDAPNGSFFNGGNVLNAYCQTWSGGSII